VTKARRARMLSLGMAVAAAAVLAAGFVAAATLTGGGDSPPLPADTPAPPESPTPTASPTPSPGSPESGDCSAAALQDPEATYPQNPQPELPPAVREMRERIVNAALQCDYDTLNALALDGRDLFSYSFGDPDEEPGEYWQMIEEAKPRFREPVLSLLVQTLDLSYCTQRFEDPEGEGMVTQYEWPSAQCDTPTDEQWAELEGLYTDEEIQTMKDFGGFIGWRIGILEDGDWISYIAGD
jgi:hypothetical protein